MKNNNQTKTSQAERMRAAIQSVMPNTSEGFYTFADIFMEEIWKKHGTKELKWAMHLWDFDHPGNSSKFIERISRRKFRCNPSVKLDIAEFDHYLSFVLESICDALRENKGGIYRKVLVEHIPEILATIPIEERDQVFRKTFLISEGKELKLKRSEKKKSSVSKIPAPEVLVPSLPIQNPTMVAKPVQQTQMPQVLVPQQSQQSIQNATSQPTISQPIPPQQPLSNTTQHPVPQIPQHTPQLQQVL